MYKVDFLPIAKKDIEDIIYYISHSLKNIIAAKRLRDLFVKGLEYIAEFPYSSPIYQSKRNLENEYRSYKVKNFLIFYIIDEEEKRIVISRVLYQKMDINNILN